MDGEPMLGPTSADRPTSRGAPLAAGPGPAPERAVVSRPAEVLRAATATREVLEELRHDDLNDDARRRAHAIYDRTVEHLGQILSDDLRQELADLAPTGTSGDPPSTDELRVADAQLTGWLDGLLQNMQAAVAAQMQQAQLAEAEAQADARAERDAAAARRRRGTSYL